MPNQIFTSLLEALEEEYGSVTQAEIAKALRVTQPTISNWKNGGEPSKSNLKKLIEFFRAHHAATLIKPLLEFEPIQPLRSGNEWRFSAEQSVIDHIKGETEHRRGVYLFYDSSGHAIYLGKTESSLYGEAKQRLKATPNRGTYVPIKTTRPQMGQVARYLSAYEVTNVAAVKNLESFMLRAFANDLRNKNGGTFKPSM
jgi:transcriptional regulator with XRE-family HTH domain